MGNEILDLIWMLEHQLLAPMQNGEKVHFGSGIERQHLNTQRPKVCH
jgi:hypothetical protein